MFYLEKINDYKVLKSDYLNDVNHCFTTRNVEISDFYPNNFYLSPQQTHSDHVEIVDERFEYPDTDGLIIAQKNIPIALRFADCTPLIFYDINKSSQKVIEKIILEITPDIIVFTGHDQYYGEDIKDLDNYENSKYFIKAIRNVRKHFSDIVIIAGACSSHFEALIGSGANIASSPKRVNIHALDPAIVAGCLSFSDKNSKIDIIKILEKRLYQAFPNINLDKFIEIKNDIKEELEEFKDDLKDLIKKDKE